MTSSKKHFKGNYKWLVESEEHISKQELCILTLYVYDVLFQNYKLLKIRFSIVFILWLALLLTTHKINVNTQTSMTQSSEISEDRTYHVKTKMLRFGCLSLDSKTSKAREKNSIFRFVYKQ